MARCPEDQKIAVRGLASGTDQRDVEDYFGRIGRVIDIWTRDTGSDMFGFVGFESKADFEEALTHNGKELNGSTMRIEPKGAPRGGGGPRGGNRDANKIFVRGVNDASDSDIRAYFEKIGPINDFFRREGAGFCIVGFENNGDQQTALRKSGEEISGNRITVEPKGGAGAGAAAGGAGDRRSPPRRRRSSTPPRRRRSSSPRRRRDS
eukprot:PhM_4_TR1769/c1_g1_i5/m.38242/K13044/HNRNPABD; heterogeneous nuclear ribonucleoprotein A/B/D